ncbi:HNH endonuclease [Vibrio fortis]|uniref:Putative HNH nuclease YajD n=1 Tax=Vibrio fortis TaxID=212667 RepID=A0A5N3QTD8_9VIBR|nr:HNH endonuclease signature motif containing protein [Vibrio fortis]KAB0285456.1 HNH endonuclease [Vibrio fortis]
MARKVCASAGCRNITTKRFCSQCQIKVDIRDKESAKKRAKKSAKRYDPKYQAFYKSPEWKALRERKIKQEPLCETCKDNGFIREGQDVDHVIEIKDDFSLRLDITNLRTLCRSCHVHKTVKVRKAREEKNVGRMGW